MISRLARAAALAALVTASVPAPSALASEWGVEGQVGYFSLTAGNSAQAVFDSSGGVTFGGGARFALDNGIFVAGTFRSFSKDGERVFVAGTNSSVFKLGHPLTVKINPTSLTAGYRFHQGRLIVPYAGVGLTLASFKEDSDVAGQPYPESRTKAGFHALGGVEVGRGLLRGGAEVVWSTVPDGVGFGGVTQVYHENNLGGFTFLGKLVLAFGGKGAQAPDTP